MLVTFVNKAVHLPCKGNFWSQLSSEQKWGMSPFNQTEWLAICQKNLCACESLAMAEGVCEETPQSVFDHSAFLPSWTLKPQRPHVQCGHVLPWVGNQTRAVISVFRGENSSFSSHMASSDCQAPRKPLSLALAHSDASFCLLDAPHVLGGW